MILSYNRPMQLGRILSRFEGVDADGIEIVVKDDRSPKLGEIAAVVERFSKALSVPTRLSVNERNLGYDANLLDSFRVAEGQYVFLLSDDDFIDGQKIEETLAELSKGECDVYFAPYSGPDGVSRIVSLTIGIDVKRDAAALIYNSVLFSGLVIRREAARKLDLDYHFLAGSIYSQVYLCTALIFKSQCFGGLPKGLLYLGGDGDNYFGSNEASVDGEKLRDRAHIASNLIYQRYLWKVVERLSVDVDPGIFAAFSAEYRLRLVAHCFRARSLGADSYKRFLVGYRDHAVMRSRMLDVLVYSMYLMPSGWCLWGYEVGKRVLRKFG